MYQPARYKLGKYKSEKYNFPDINLAKYGK